MSKPTDTQIRLACSVDAAGHRSGQPLTLTATGPDNLTIPNGYIVRHGLRVGARFRSFGTAMRAFEFKRENLGYTTISTA
jgi:hypothetical protein